IIGVVERAWLQSRPDGGGREGRARVRLSGEEADAPILRKIQAGIIRHVSVGYITHRMDEVDPADPRKKVPPVFRATRWEPVELSFCAVPADAGAGVRSTDEHAEFPCLVTRRTNMDDPTATVERRTRAEERPPGDGDPDPKDPPPPPPPDPPDDDQGDDLKAKATDEDRARIAEITNAVGPPNLPAPSPDPFTQ